MRELYPAYEKEFARGLDNSRESLLREHSRPVFLRSQLANMRAEGSGMPNESACSVIRP